MKIRATCVTVGPLSALLLLAASPSLAAQAWTPFQTVRTYAIAGRTAPALYRSIGERGPKIGATRVIAQTSFKLTWTRKYENHTGACVLAAAKPKLTISTTLPKPSVALDPALKARWDAFYEGLKTHEAAHAASMVEMTRQTEAETVGLTVPDDPDCKKLKAKVAGIAFAASVGQRDRSREFDRVEMGKGGNVERLVLGLLNG